MLNDTSKVTLYCPVQGSIPKLSYNSRYICYLLQSEIRPQRTYFGFTVDLKHRLRQHNGEITGGAKYTHVGRPWKVIGYVSGFPDKSTALSFEWWLHHPPVKRRGLKGKIEVVQDIIEKFKVKESQLSLTWTRV